MWPETLICIIKEQILLALVQARNKYLLKLHKSTLITLIVHCLLYYPAQFNIILGIITMLL
nr:MAG TPA: hypothetical protein [Caudoviricetes sp.]